MNGMGHVDATTLLSSPHLDQEHMLTTIFYCMKVVDGHIGVTSKIQSEFGAPNLTVTKPKALVAANGILATPNPKPGRSLPQETQDLVVNFYENDDNSRMMAGKKDSISV